MVKGIKINYFLGLSKELGSKFYEGSRTRHEDCRLDKKHMKKAEMYIDRKIVYITIKMSIIV